MNPATTPKPRHSFALFEVLKPENKIFVHTVTEEYSLTFQEFRELVTIARDYEMWQKGLLDSQWLQAEKLVKSDWPKPEQKKRILETIKKAYEKEKLTGKNYSDKPQKPNRAPLRITAKGTDKKIHGDCPVASPETVCCNLKTIDAVENCGFGCSYCTIQTFYGDEALIDANLKDKLSKIPIDPNRYYHYGTGQSSDSLIWGNRNGILDDLCDWAGTNSNILLEFKTKSDNISYFLEKTPPTNVVLSWSLNPQIVIDHEEHFTAPLDRRLAAARKAADSGVKVSFHFHPMIYFEGWERDYSDLAKRVQGTFSPEEVLFISLGSVTFIKPVMQAIRKRGEPTKILQMELVKAPHNKWTYPSDLKIKMFRNMYAAFNPWHEKVFFYLCMEEAKFWEATFGSYYKSNELFEQAMLQSCFKKITKS